MYKARIHKMSLFGYIGKYFIIFADHFLGLHVFFFDMIRSGFTRLNRGERSIARKELIEQIYHAGIGALPSILFFATISGSILVFQFVRLSHQYDIGSISLLLICRELGPIVTALIIIMRSAASIFLEINHLNMSGRIEAMRASGKNPLALICLPKLIGMIISFICLTIIFDIAAFVCGYLVILFTTKVEPNNFLEQVSSSLNLTDIFVGAVKPFLFSIIVAVICIFRGFKAYGEYERFAKASNSAAESFFYCMLINILISTPYYI